MNRDTISNHLVSVGYNTRDLMSLIDEQYDVGFTASLDDSMRIYEFAEFVLVVECCGISFFSPFSQTDSA